MVINPEQYEDPSELFDEFIDPIISSTKDTETVVEYCEDLLINDATETILDSRSPRLYIFGRSGAGKSCLINALANKQVTEVGAVEPTTVSSNVYDITFPNRNAKWEIVDSRGIFETVPPDGGDSVETVEQLETDLVEYNPDILLHVMTPDQVRSGEDDFNAVEQINDSIIGGLPPRVMCVNKIDSFYTQDEDWPPEQNEMLQQRITDELALLRDILSISDYQGFREDEPFRGHIYNSNKVIGAFPMYLKDEPYWNLTTFAELLSEYLPNEAVLQFAQAQRRKRIMRRLARKQTTAVAKAVKHIPRKLILNPKVPIITGFELYLVAVIASFSGREFGPNSVRSFTRSASTSVKTTLSTLSGVAFDTIYSRDMNYIRNNMYCAGRAAEVYFFEDKFVEPEEFIPEARECFAGD